MAVKLPFYFQLEELVENFPEIKEEFAKHPNQSKYEFSLHSNTTYAFDYIFPLDSDIVIPAFESAEIRESQRFQFFRATISLDDLLYALNEFADQKVVGILYKNEKFPLDDVIWRNLLMDLLLYPEVIQTNDLEIVIVTADEGFPYSLWYEKIPGGTYILLSILERHRKPIHVNIEVTYEIDIVRQEISSDETAHSINTDLLLVMAPVSVFNGQIVPVSGIGLINKRLRPARSRHENAHPNIGGFTCFGSHTPSFKNLPILTVGNYSSAFHTKFALTTQYLQQIALQLLLEDP